MVLAYHLIFTTYGFWLPNDPRGSTSKEIRVEPIKDLSALHYGRKAVQPSSKEIREFHDKAHDLLKHPVLTFDDEEIALAGKALGNVIADREYVCYACAVMPDHVHILIRRHRDRAEEMIEQFQNQTRTALIEAGKRSHVQPVWTDGPGWKTFVNSQWQFWSEIKYIEMNPKKAGRAGQNWEFVQPYDGWMPE